MKGEGCSTGREAPSAITCSTPRRMKTGQQFMNGGGGGRQICTATLLIDFVKSLADTAS